MQGWARDVKARDRDVDFTSRDETETRPRRDVRSSRDVIEKSKAGLDVVVIAVVKIHFSRSLAVCVF